MKSFLLVTATLIWAFGSVAAYNSAAYTDKCHHQETINYVAIAGTWPLVVVMVGLISVLGGDPGIYACGSNHATFK
jgi:hypothetical protein